MSFTTTTQWDNVPGFDPKTAEFVRLDVEKWLEEHEIAKDAKDRGAENLPPSDAKGLGDQERKIVAWIEGRARDCHQQVTGYLSDLRRALVDIEDDAGLKILGQEAGEVVARGKTELDQQVGEELLRLETRKEDFHLEETGFKQFRQNAGLHRVADYSHRGTALRFILFCFVIEVILNAALLMDVNAFGLVGSIAQMGLISAVNVLILGLAMGALLRQLHHVSRTRKILASITMGAVVAAVIVFNLAVGHFRDSMQMVLGNPSADIYSLGNDALVRVVDGPLRFESFQSALLALLGCLFFAVASWKWLQRDDPYPDYGRRSRQMNKVQEEYRACVRAAGEALQAAYSRHEGKLQDMRHNLQIHQEKWQDTCLRGTHIRDEYLINMAQYQVDLNRLLEGWRTVNRDHRTGPAPTYFDEHTPIDPDLLGPVTFDPPASTPITDVMDAIHTAISTLQEHYTDRASQYRPLRAITRSDGAGSA